MSDLLIKFFFFALSSHQKYLWAVGADTGPTRVCELGGSISIHHDCVLTEFPFSFHLIGCVAHFIDSTIANGRDTPFSTQVSGGGKTNLADNLASRNCQLYLFSFRFSNWNTLRTRKRSSMSISTSCAVPSTRRTYDAMWKLSSSEFWPFCLLTIVLF